MKKLDFRNFPSKMFIFLMLEEFTELSLRRCNNPPHDWGGELLSKISEISAKKARKQTKELEADSPSRNRDSVKKVFD